MLDGRSPLVPRITELAGYCPHLPLKLPVETPLWPPITADNDKKDFVVSYLLNVVGRTYNGINGAAKHSQTEKSALSVPPHRTVQI